MLKEAELDRFLDEFFDGTMPVQSEEKNTDESTKKVLQRSQRQKAVNGRE